jgi:hypothetical protein
MTVLHCRIKIVQARAVNGVQTGGTLKQTWMSSNMFFVCPCVTDKLKLKSAEILDCCHSQQCKIAHDFVGSKKEVNSYASLHSRTRMRISLIL